MGPSRAVRKTTVLISSDEEDNHLLDDAISDDDFSVLTSQIRRQSPQKTQTRVSRKSTTTKTSQSPTKASPRKSTGKGKVKPSQQDKGNAKGTIFSFFNNATQRQQQRQPFGSQNSTPTTSQSTSNAQKRKDIQPLAVEEDIIDSIDDGEDRVQISAGSAVALAAKKRKQNDVSHLFDADVFNAAAGSQKFRKSSSGMKVVSHGGGTDRRPWTEQFGPIDLTELGVHKKKVADVRALLEEAMSSRARPRLIVLKGPAGVGKTTTVQLLAKDLGAQVKGWKNPDDVGPHSENTVSASAQFEDFLFRSGRFNGLSLGTDAGVVPGEADSPDDQSRRHIMLMEEFPSAFSRTSTVLQSFRATIMAYLSVSTRQAQNLAPLVLVLSETLLSSSSSGDVLAPHRLLGPEILSHPLTATIEFNPVATTLLIKALSTIAVKESRISGRRRTPGPAVLAKLAEMGDIRSAVSAFEFLCLRSDDDNAWSAKINFSKTKSTRKPDATAAESMTEQEREALKIIGGRETALELWHAVGKVVYNKRVEPRKPIAIPAAHLAHSHRPRQPENEPDQLFAECCTDTATYVASIHENVPASWSSGSAEKTLESMEACLDVFSDTDILLPEQYRGTDAAMALEGARQDELAFHVAVRGIVFNLPYPVKRDTGMGTEAGRGRANVMSWPRSLRLWREREEIEDMLELCMEEYSKIQQNLTAALDPSVDKDVAGGESGSFLVPLRPSAANKTDMTLDQAPYMKLIQEARRSGSLLSGHISKVARLSTLHGSDAGSRTTGLADGADEEVMPERKRRTRTGQDVGSAIFGVQDDVKGLVLSDDDIVDD